MSEKTPFIVTIDGPTASGKTTVAREVANRFNLFHLQGGTFLRAFALYILKSGANPNNHNLLDNFQLNIIEQDNGNAYTIVLNGEIINNQMWTPEIDGIVSITSQPSFVRAARIEWKRGFAKNRRLIADGRTLGSEVFPSANIKIHLTASLEQRAQRRHEQYIKSGIVCDSLSAIKNQINNRDESDAQGTLDRTLIYPDQNIIDSSIKSLPEIISEISKLIESTEVFSK